MDRVLCVILCSLVIVAALCILVYCNEPIAEPTVLLADTETTQADTEPTEETTVATEPPVVLYDVPLDAELQRHIIETAEAYGIDPAIIIAMAWKESTYRSGSIGDSGRSYGLLQIQKKWHKKRMARLGCTDLLDPYQNVTVGVDYLAEQTKRYGGDIAKGLTAYNRGHYSGTVTKYAKTILAKAEKLNNERSRS